MGSTRWLQKNKRTLFFIFMFRRVLLSMLLLLAAASSWAFVETVLVVELKDGTILNYSMFQSPYLILNGDKLEIHAIEVVYPDPENPTPESGMLTPNDVNLIYQVDQVKNFHFEEYILDAIQETVAEQPSIWIKQKDNQTVTLSGTVASDHIHLYSIDGRMVQTYVASDNGETSISISDLEKGIYIIQVNKKVSFKILKQ